MNWKLRELGQPLSCYPNSGPCYLLLMLTERLLLTSAGFVSDPGSPWPGGLELCSWLTQTLPPKAGMGKKHEKQLHEGWHEHFSARAPQTHDMSSYLREQVKGTRCKWSKRHLRPSCPSWFLERLKGKRRWQTKTHLRSFEGKSQASQT